jgi:hypothetical protein
MREGESRSEYDKPTTGRPGRSVSVATVRQHWLDFALADPTIPGFWSGTDDRRP